MFEDLTKSLYMDFEGQKLAECYFERIIVASSLIGLIIGYSFQQFFYTIISLAVGFVLASLISIPPWPMYRRHPLKWQKHVHAVDDGDSHQNESPPSQEPKQQTTKGKNAKKQQ